MALSIASNSDSIGVQTSLARTTTELSKSFERLSSGLRINSASDDPAGLQLADALRRDSIVATAAIRNTNDGISIASLVDDALGEVYNILTRMSELANQSANGTYSTYQRSALSLEFVALGSEIERISKTTTFNGFNLLSNSQAITIQAGFDGSSNSRITINNVLATLSSLNLGNAGGALTFSIIDVSSTGAQAAATTALDAVNAAINSLTATRGVIGAAESRLSKALGFLQVARENFTAAESRIRDVDVASEVAKMVRLQVLQQAATAVLAQANQQPSRVLALLS